MEGRQCATRWRLLPRHWLSEPWACAVPDSRDPRIYRQRAQVWRQRAALLREDDPKVRTCLIIADSYERLACLIEIHRQLSRRGDDA